MTSRGLVKASERKAFGAKARARKALGAKAWERKAFAFFHQARRARSLQNGLLGLFDRSAHVFETNYIGVADQMDTP